MLRRLWSAWLWLWHGNFYWCRKWGCFWSGWEDETVRWTPMDDAEGEDEIRWIPVDEAEIKHCPHCFNLVTWRTPMTRQERIIYRLSGHCRGGDE